MIGAGLAIRSATALPLFVGGLAGMALPSLALLAAVGSADDVLPWRTVGLLGGAVIMALVAAVLDRIGRAGPGRLALIAVLLGSLLKQAAPFILGVLVMPIENAIVFVVQSGTNIAALPWWITLATAGAALLVIAVTYERRASSKGVGARRLRGLR